MNKIKPQHKKNMRKRVVRGLILLIAALIAIAAIIAAIVCLFCFSPSISGMPCDDQRSTLWPMLISLVVTMLGSLITTYVFLKGALDRTLDEKPYYRAVIDKYRKKTMRLLWVYACVSLLYISFIFLLYPNLYFAGKRSPAHFRMFLSAVYLPGVICSAYILHHCIYIEKGLNNTALKLLKTTLKKSQDYPRNVRAIQTALKLDNDNLIAWLQIEGDCARCIDEKKFISRFSEWETLMTMLVEQKTSTMGQHFREEQLEFVIKKGMGVKHLDKGTEDTIEWEDAKINRWFSESCEMVYNCEQTLARTANSLPSMKRLSDVKRLDSDGAAGLADCLIDEFLFLVHCRNLLQCLMDTAPVGKGRTAQHQNWIEDHEDRLAEIFFSFLIGLSVAIFRISPRIETFFPSGRFCVSDFYGVRFENSSFRSSLFSYAIFARTKINNSNFSLCKFETCEFFSADFRDCSFGNTYWESCSLREAMFHFADLTGAELRQCNLTYASFYRSTLLNMTLDMVALVKNDLIDCKIENINLHLRWDYKGHILLQGCNFSDSAIMGISLKLDSRPAAYGGRSSSRDATILALQSSINNPVIQDLLCSGVDQENRFPDMMGAFQLKCNPFPDHPGLNRRKSEIPTHPVWVYIKQMAVIFMEESIFNNTVMPSFRFYRTNLEQCVFRGTQMDSSRLFCVYMLGCIMPGVNLRRSSLWAVVLQSVALEDAIFFQSVCKLVNFEDAAMQRLHASEATMQYCSFSRSDCRNIDLTRARIADSLFWDTILTQAELTGAQFYSVRFDNAVADQMLASYTFFQQCSLSNAYLAASNFNYTIFENCDFRLANFSKSTFTSAVFRRCNFAGSNFDETCFIKTVFEDCTNLETASFAMCRMISPDFRGICRGLEKELFKDIVYVI